MINISEYESEGSTIAKAYASWMSGISAHHTNEENKSDGDIDGDTFDMMYIQCEPKWKWFKPPFYINIWKWQISFMWAYNIHKAYELKNCYPTGMSTSMGDKELEVSFSCNKLDNDKITTAAEKLTETMKSMENEEE